MRARIIAEIGINHNGDESQAYPLIDAAVAAKADVAKFQIFKPHLLTEDTKKLEMLRGLELPRAAYPRLNAYCRQRGIDFSCTAFDADSLAFLLENTDMAFIKIASPSIAHPDLLQKAAKAKKPIILSTGSADFSRLYAAESILSGCDLTFLHCVSLYPCPPEKSNLKRMVQLKSLQKPVGISDHSGDIFMPLAAVTLGARTVECHLTMDKSQIGPDHRSSLDPHQFGEMVRGIRAIERATT